MNKIEAVIFDMDGLLIDSEPFWRQSHIAALARYGVSITEDDVRAMAGRRTDEVARHWRNNYGLLHVENEVLEASVVAKVTGCVNIRGKELPGVKSLVLMLESRHVPMAVASSSAPEIIDAVLKKLDLARHMQVAYSAKYEQFGKPHPGIFLSTAKKLDVSPARCVVFEDSLSGIRAAKAAGMKCIAVPEEANIHKAEFRDEADLVAGSLQSIDWKTIMSV